MGIIYFDHNATTKLDPLVLNKMNELYKEPINALATHNLGRKGAQELEEARKSIKNLLNADTYEVTFTSSGTESSNLAIFGSEADVIFLSKIEHTSTFNSRPNGARIIEIESLENGVIDIEDFKKKLEEVESSNFLVSILLANNETGAIQPVEEISKLVHQKGGLIHSDIVQAVGKIDVDLEKLNVDFASVSAHKINGPQGVGALLHRKGLNLKPIIFGGGQEKSKRAGTSNIAGIAGFGEACKLAKAKIELYKETESLRDFLELKMKEVAGDNIEIFSKNVARLPNTSYSSLRNSDNQTQLINFDLNNICVSAGSACSSGTLKISKVLQAMKVKPELLQGAIRVSLGIENTKEEVEKFITIWTKFYQRIQH